MAFPSTYNFNYYKGDTFEFRIYPKNSNGSAFDLTTYDLAAVPPGDGGKFTIARSRGAAGVASRVTASAVISLVDNSIICTITPTVGNQLIAGSSYFYDVEISKGNGSTVYTLLTGGISITDQITGATA